MQIWPEVGGLTTGFSFLINLNLALVVLGHFYMPDFEDALDRLYIPASRSDNSPTTPCTPRWNISQAPDLPSISTLSGYPSTRGSVIVIFLCYQRLSCVLEVTQFMIRLLSPPRRPRRYFADEAGVMTR